MKGNLDKTSKPLLQGILTDFDTLSKNARLLQIQAFESSIARLSSLLRKQSTPLMVFLVLTFVFLLIGTYFNVTWEQDAQTRADQALYLSQRGLYWYFFQGFGQGYYVWLPLWQLLLAVMYLSTGLSPIQGGTFVSAVSGGLSGLFVYFILRNPHTDGGRPLLGVSLLMTSGYFVAYASQGMTDVFSAMLFLGSVYYILEFMKSRRWRFIAVASVLTLLNVMTRYEAWLFLAVTIVYALFLIPWRDALDWKSAFKVSTFAIPSALFILVWLYYNTLVSGSYFGFASWIAQSVTAQPTPFSHNFPLTFANLAYVLLLSNGLLWLALLDLRNREGVISISSFSLLLFAVYSVYFLYATYAGLNAGWVRHFLYFSPLSSVAFVSRGYRKEVIYAVLVAQVILGEVGFAQNAVFHQIATAPH